MTLAELGMLVPLLLPCLAGAAVLLLTVAPGRSSEPGHQGAHLAVLALAALGGSMWLLSRFAENTLSVSGSVTIDGLSVVFGLTLLGLVCVVVVLGQAHLIEHEQSLGEFLALVLFATAGMLLVIVASDLMVMFVGLEIVSLASTTLIGYRRSSRWGQEAALKHFIFSAFAAGFGLFGLALLYGEVGRLGGAPSVSLHEVARAFTGGEGFSALGWVGAVFLAGSLLARVAAAPFHLWAPDVFDGASTPAAALMGSAVKVAVFGALIRFADAVFLSEASGATATLASIVEWSSVATMLSGSLLALRQSRLKRLLAYLSVAHVGFLLMGFSAWLLNPSGGALTAISFELLGQGVMFLGAFGFVLFFERREDRRLEVDLRSLAGVGRRYPSLSIAMLFFMLGLGGIPPTVGFFGKFAIFSAAIGAGHIALVVVAGLCCLICASSCLRVVTAMYMTLDERPGRTVRSWWLAAGLLTCAIVTGLLGLMPDLHLEIARRVLAGWSG